MSYQDSSQFLLASQDYEPRYLSLYRSGELYARVKQAMVELENCHACPRECGVNRLSGETAVCKSGRYAVVASYHPHMGEEDPLRGWRGSGTIFFSWCNLRCVFCQNYDISQEGAGVEDLIRGPQPVRCHRGCGADVQQYAKNLPVPEGDAHPDSRLQGVRFGARGGKIIKAPVQRRRYG